MLEHSMGMQRIDDAVEREVRLLGVSGISFSDTVSNMAAVINSDPGLVTKVREMAFGRGMASSMNGGGTVRQAEALEVPHDLERRRAKKGEVRPFGFYQPYVLKLLRDAPGHSMRTKQALSALEPILRPHLKPADYAGLPKTGGTRWENKVQWARLRLVEDGLLQTVEQAGRGVWALTSAGLKAAHKHT
jgi:hypothetical protein